METERMYEDFGNMIWKTETGKHIKVKDLSPVKLNDAIMSLQKKSEELRKVIDHKPFKYRPPDNEVNETWQGLINLKKEVDRVVFILRQYQLHKQGDKSCV